jgi:hypothetical protein
MKLVWESLNFGNPKASWTLWRMNGLRYVARLGSMRLGPDGYRVYSADHLHQQFQPRVCRLPNELTLDEAKDAAKLILAAGRQS